MAITTSTASAVIQQEMSDKFLRDSYESYGVASSVSSLIISSTDSVSFPKIVGASPTAWVGEGEQFTNADMQFDQVEVTPRKVGAVSTITSETMADVSAGGGMASMVMDSLTRRVVEAIDAALFSTVTGAPDGLESLTDVNEIDAGDAFDSVDPFTAAVYAAQGRNAELSAFVAHPDDALTLAQIKRADGSREPLLLSSAVDGKLVTTVNGVPLLTSTYVTKGTCWGLPKDRVLTVQRSGSVVDTSTDARFVNDEVVLRIKARIGFGFIDEPSIQKITVGGAEGN